MDIYPIVPGQKLSGKNVIPPHTPLGKPETPADNSPAVAGGTGDLIDFGESSPAPAAAAAPAPKRDSKDITGMLQATGKDKNARDGGEPLIDFASDMKKELPKADQSSKAQGSGVKRSETESSSDAFFDALE